MAVSRNPTPARQLVKPTSPGTCAESNQSGRSPGSIQPLVCEWGGRIQLGKGGEQEQRGTGAAGYVDLLQSGLHGSHALAVCRDREHSKILPPELPLVLLG